MANFVRQRLRLYLVVVRSVRGQFLNPWRVVVASGRALNPYSICFPVLSNYILPGTRLLRLTGCFCIRTELHRPHPYRRGFRRTVDVFSRVRSAGLQGKLRKKAASQPRWVRKTTPIQW